ncbi:Conserved_hypothetical protein [Hexamita inflata]|uniref:Uncharacterized protein n=1 Tax=Hexamita inflata TaxID=28002 RepID=A0AA86PQ76_9EUKA|nr:Conserved hypothetical protein [Hexamita inflata]
MISEYAKCAFITQNIGKVYIYDCQFKLLAHTVDLISSLFYNIENVIEIEGTAIIFTFQGKLISGLTLQCNAQVNMSSLNIRGLVTGSQLTIFYGICKELNSQVNLYKSSIQIEYDDLQAFYGFTYLSVSKFVLNQTELSVKGTQTEVFFGIAHELGPSQIENSSFNFKISSQKSYALVEVQVGSLSINNITVSGSITGNDVYGLIYEAQAAVVINNIIFSLVMNGANSCAFVFKITGSGSVSQNNISLSGIQSNAIAPSALAIGLTCPCPLGAWLVKGICHCTAYSIFDPDSQTCKCISGPLLNGICCPINSIMINSICVCQPINTVLDNGECKCTIMGQELTNLGLICKCKTTNSIVDTSKKCVCVSDATNNTATNTCECPSDSVFDSTSQTCICPKYAEMKNSVCICSQTLLKGSSMKNGQCACPADTSIELDECKCTTQNAILSNGICACGPNAYNQSNICTTCPSGSQLVNGVCEKQCRWLSFYKWKMQMFNNQCFIRFQWNMHLPFRLSQQHRYKRLRMPSQLHLQLRFVSLHLLNIIY